MTAKHAAPETKAGWKRGVRLVMVALALAMVLYLPVLLTYAEMAAGRPGSASAYQISRFHNPTGVTFLVGWLMLAGLVSAATLMSRELKKRTGLLQILPHCFRAMTSRK